MKDQSGVLSPYQPVEGGGGIFNEEELKALAEEHSVELCQVDDLFGKNKQAMSFSTAQGLLAFMGSHGDPVVFYKYTCVESGQFAFSDEELEEVAETVGADADTVERVFRQDIRRYEKYEAARDASEPIILEMVGLYQGRVLEWIGMSGWMFPSTYLIHMYAIHPEEYGAALEQEQQATSRQRDDAISEVREKLLADKSFHLCTNQSLRRRYLQQMWQTDPVIQTAAGGKLYEAFQIVETTWREYRATRGL